MLCCRQYLKSFQQVQSFIFLFHHLILHPKINCSVDIPERKWYTMSQKMMHYIICHITLSRDGYIRSLFIEHSGDISCSLLVNQSHTDESWEGRKTCMWIYRRMKVLSVIKTGEILILFANNRLKSSLWHLLTFWDKGYIPLRHKRWMILIVVQRRD